MGQPDIIILDGPGCEERRRHYVTPRGHSLELPSPICPRIKARFAAATISRKSRQAPPAASFLSRQMFGAPASQLQWAACDRARSAPVRGHGWMERGAVCQDVAPG